VGSTALGSLHTPGQDHTNRPSGAILAAFLFQKEDLPMTYIPVYRVSLVRDGSLKVDNRAISSPNDAYEILRQYLGQPDREIFTALLLSTRNTCIGIHVVSIGTLNSALIHPRDFWKAVILSNAAAVIVCHTHPSGDPSASSEDLALTARLRQTADLFGIPILDHLILGGDNFISLKERGVL